jgi:hypothetical protein
MLERGVIQASSSPWSAPSILIPKKTVEGQAKRWRFCCDFRALNKISRFDCYNLPLFEETVSTLYGSRYFSTLDLESGFHQLKVAKQDKEKTAFSTPWGAFHWNRVPMGLSNSPSSFQRLMDELLKYIKGQEAWVLLDDIVLFSDTIEQHAIRLGHVFERFEKAYLLL